MEQSYLVIRIPEQDLRRMAGICDLDARLVGVMPFDCEEYARDVRGYPAVSLRIERGPLKKLPMILKNNALRLVFEINETTTLVDRRISTADRRETTVPRRPDMFSTAALVYEHLGNGGVV